MRIPMAAPMTSFISGLDLGQTVDYTAFIIAEVTSYPDPDPDRKEYMLNKYVIRHIQRWELGTKYLKIIDDLKQMYSAIPNLPGSQLVVDASGVGRPVVEVLRAARVNASIRAYTITAGYKEGPYEKGYGTVPKLHLCGTSQAVVQQRRVTYAGKLELGPVLEKEMEKFEVKVTSDRNETFAAWRENEHDDLVLAMALLLWRGERSTCAVTAPCLPRQTIAQQSAKWNRR
jgi:hypothetical protein